MVRRIAGIDAAAVVVWLDRLWMGLALVAVLAGVVIGVASATGTPVPSIAPTLFIVAGTLAVPPMAIAWVGRRVIDGVEPVRP